MRRTGYDDGYADGKRDALDGFRARASRLWKRAYLDGYSDGYAAGKDQPKSW